MFNDHQYLSRVDLAANDGLLVADSCVVTRRRWTGRHVCVSPVSSVINTKCGTEVGAWPEGSKIVDVVKRRVNLAIYRALAERLLFDWNIGKDSDEFGLWNKREWTYLDRLSTVAERAYIRTYTFSHQSFRENLEFIADRAHGWCGSTRAGVGTTVCPSCRLHVAACPCHRFERCLAKDLNPLRPVVPVPW
jgi:hypothetical protein